MKFLILFFLSFNLYAKNSFYCEATAILKMDFMGKVEEGKLLSGITVIIEGTPFLVEKENVVKFVDKKTSKGHAFGFLVKEKDTGYWISLKTLNGVGKVSTDYRGITLDNKDVDCLF